MPTRKPTNHGRSEHATLSTLREHVQTLCRGRRAGERVRIQPERALAELLGCSRGHLRKALATLEQEGCLAREKGRGTFVLVPREERRNPAAQTQRPVLLSVPSAEHRQFRCIRDGFQEVVEAAGYPLLVNYDYGQSSLLAEGILRAMEQGAAGVCLSGLKYQPISQHHVAPLQRFGIPVALCCMYTEQSVRAPRVTIDKREAGRVLGEFLCEKGHREIAAVLSVENEVDRVVVEGIEDAYAEQGVDVSGMTVVSPANYMAEFWNLENNDFRTKMIDFITGILDSPTPPTAIIATTDTNAEEIFYALSSLGVRVPDEISLVGFGVRPRQDGLLRYLSAITYDGVERGRLAGQQLIRMMRGELPISANPLTLLPLRMHVGETTADLTQPNLGTPPTSNAFFRTA